jgi:hypothetical protein
MTRLLIELSVIAVLLTGGSVDAGQLLMDNEINHLLQYVETSECSFIRNDNVYPGEKAVEHINKKYEHFHNRIQSAEDFIDYSATKSELSGKYYYVECPEDSRVRLKDRLLVELEKNRDEQQISSPLPGPDPDLQRSLSGP